MVLAVRKEGLYLVSTTFIYFAVKDTKMMASCSPAQRLYTLLLHARAMLRHVDGIATLVRTKDAVPGVMPSHHRRHIIGRVRTASSYTQPRHAVIMIQHY